MEVAGLVLAAALVIGVFFTLLLNRELIRVYREFDRQRRRVMLTRVLPIALGLSALILGGAIVGAVTGHGALVGAIVTTVAIMALLMVTMRVALAVEIVRGDRQDR